MQKVPHLFGCALPIRRSTEFARAPDAGQEEDAAAVRVLGDMFEELFNEDLGPSC